jgi:hypothetical protein
MRRVLIDGLISLVVIGWTAATAGLALTAGSSQAMADVIKPLQGCPGQVPCPEVGGNCGCNTVKTLGQCGGWGIFCVDETIRCPGLDVITRAPCGCASGCGSN